MTAASGMCYRSNGLYNTTGRITASKTFTPAFPR